MTIKTKKNIFLPISITLLVAVIISIMWYLRISNTSKVNVSSYKSPYGFTTGFGLKATTEDTLPEMLKEFLLNYSDFDKPITLTFNNTQTEKEREVILTLYLDYKQINFKVTDNKYSNEYVFNIDGSQQIELPVYLDKTLVPNDDKYHKLMISFVTGYDKKAYQFEKVENQYGITCSYDIIFNKSALNSQIDDIKDYIKNNYPDNYFEFQSEPIILNTDYNNKAQKKDKDFGISLPNNLVTISKGNALDLMYNITNYNNFKNALLVITVDYKQEKINNDDCYIMTLGENGVYNGKISLSMPNQTGYYEVIGYVIYNPYEKISTDLGNSKVNTSYRFTVNITD